MTLRVCLVGEFEKPPTEAMRKTAQEYAKRLEEHCELLRINSRKAYKPSSLRAIRSFDPDIVHFIPGPSILSFAYSKLAGAIGDAKVIHSAPLPAFYDIDGGLYYQFSHHSRHLIPALKPDKILVQSERSYDFFSQYGIDCEYLFSGVDLDTFKPVDSDTKAAYREKYGLPQDEHLSLHVGSLKRWRNVHRLPEIVGEDSQLVVIGSTATPEEQEVKRELEASGAIVIHEYIEEIQEIYAAVDLYVFPVESAVACCDVPLSVLEAMATNLPVLTTGFGGLPTMFEAGNGIAFGSTPEELRSDFHNAIEQTEIATQSSVSQYGWDSSKEQLQSIYQEVQNE